MNKRLIPMLCLPLLLGGCVVKDNLKRLSYAAQDTLAAENYYKVVKVVDGDTIDVWLDNRNQRIRLIGINAPESVDPRRPVECFGKEASDFAKAKLSGRWVKLEADQTQADHDAYGRSLRYVTTREGLFFNLEAVKQGYAQEFTFKQPYKFQKAFREAQKAAQGKLLGLWSDKICGRRPAVKQATASSSATVVYKSPNDSCLIKGNVSWQAKKIYHLPSCPDYAKTVINPSHGERFFCSEAEAQQAGFSRAANCR